MRALLKPTLIIAGAFGFLYLCAAVFIVNFPAQADAASSLDLAQVLMPYRLLAYVGIVGTWKWLSVWLTKPAGNPSDFSVELVQQWHERRDLVARSWWKVALFFTLFELVAIQKVGI